MTLSDLTSTGVATPRTSGHAALGPVDALTPPDMARRAVDLGASKIILGVRNVDLGGFGSSLVPATPGNGVVARCRGVLACLPLTLQSQSGSDSTGAGGRQ
jgi:hypothetical protein